MSIKDKKNRQKFELNPPRLIYQIVYLTRNAFAAYSKKSALPWSKKGAWLEWAGGVMHLLSHVEGVVQCTLEGTWLWTGEWERRRE